MTRLERRWYERVSPPARVIALIGVLVTIQAVIVTSVWGTPATITGVGLSPVALALMFAFVEWRVIHIQFRAQATSFSLLEVPLVLGVLFVPPHQLVPAAMGGMILGLGFGRGQAPLKVVFNVVNVGLYTSIAWLIVDAFGPFDDPGRTVWLPVFVATALGTTGNVGGILGAITLTEGAPSTNASVRLVGFGVAMAAANTALGLVAAMLLPAEALGIALLLVPAAMVLLAFQMLASERAQRERVEFLYRSSRLLDSMEAERGPAALLDASCEMFRSELGSIVLLADERRPARALTRRVDDAVIEEVEATGELVRAFDELEAPRMASVDDGDALADVLASIGARDAMVAPLATDDRDLGLLVVANRLGDVSTFSDDDVQVLGALAAQSSVLLHNDQLEHALEELRELERRLAHQATHDSLTGLPNRALFTMRLDEVASGTEPFAVLFIDLDDFKIINDTRGHSHGDEILVEVARRLKDLLRPIDTAARLGGDEFAVIVRDHPFPRDVADRVIATMAGAFELEGERFEIGCSIGVARSEETRDTGELLQRADLAMYQAKRAGKRGVVEYEPGIDGQQEIGFRADLRRAISEGQLELHYQPLVDLGTGDIRGLEALVRWRCPERGLLLPGTFIAQAEKDGFIIPLDRWVIERATHDLDRFAAAGHDEIFVAVNVSARHLQAPDLVTHVESLAPTAEDGFGGRLILEVTETALMREVDRSRRNTAAIRDMGARFALDDFGTGYSSIGYLREFDLDVLKIAGDYVGYGTTSRRNRAFLNAMVELGHSLGLDVVGEGVEEPAQAAMLRDLGCDLAQGFLFARPAPFDLVLRRLDRRAAATPEVPLSLR